MNNNTLCTEKKSGIYIIGNKTNGKVYVGQSKNLSSRKNEHLRELRSNRHYNNYLQKSFNKYGEKNFTYTVIEHCDPCRLDDLEMKYIRDLDSMNPIKGYNLRAGGHKPKLSKVSRLKISKTRKERIAKGLIKTARGTKRTVEQRERLSEIQRNIWKDEGIRIRVSQAKSTIKMIEVRKIKELLYNNFSVKEISIVTGVSEDKISHISNIASFKHVLSEYNYYIKNRGAIIQKKQTKRVMAMYREGFTYREISEAINVHQRTAIRIVKKHKNSHDDRCRLNVMNRALKKQHSIVKTLRSMGKINYEIVKLLKSSRPVVSKLLKTNKPNVLTSLEESRGKIKPFNIYIYK